MPLYLDHLAERFAAFPYGLRSTRIAAYQKWCQKACDHFKSRGLTHCWEPGSLTRNCLEALDEVHSKGLVVTVISRGIHKFVEDKFPSFWDYFDFVQITEQLLSDSGGGSANVSRFSRQGGST